MPPALNQRGMIEAMAKAANETQDSSNKALKTLLWMGLAVGMVAAINAAIFQRTPPLMYRQKGGLAKWLPLPDGDIAYEVAGEGKPLLLLHAIGAGCSAFEWRHVFGPLSETRQVFAPAARWGRRARGTRGCREIQPQPGPHQPGPA